MSTLPIKPERIKLLLTITDRGAGEAITRVYRENGVTFSIIAPGEGAAGSQFIDVLGLTSGERDIVLSVVRISRIPRLFQMLQDRFHFDRPGTGIAAAIPITGVSGPKVLGYISGFPDHSDENSATIEREESTMTPTRDYDLIVTVVNRGFSDQVVDAAKEAGAGGGTIFYARGSGIHEVEKFFSVSIQPEKEVVLSLVHHSLTQQVMHAIIAAAGLMTEGKGLAFSLPVDEMAGVVHETLREGASQ